jgi:hypothetical protein
MKGISDVKYRLDVLLLAAMRPVIQTTAVMEMHQVRYFLAIYEEGNFTRAAKRCGVKQPSLTRAIQRLETEFGAPLFIRTRKGASLSHLGPALLAHKRLPNLHFDNGKCLLAGGVTPFGNYEPQDR